MQDVVPVAMTKTTMETTPRISRGPTSLIVVHPIHATLMSFPIACFTGALLTDLVYWKTAEMMWADFSAWLLFFGLIMGAFALIAGFIDLLADRRIRTLGAAWFHMIGVVVVLVLALLNSFVHSRDAWTSVVPTGVMLSALTVIVMLFTGWIGSSMVYRLRAGVIS
jgi:uncharacterized membrane protein